MVQGYMIKLERMNASKIRSKFKDTDVANLSVGVNGQVTGFVAKDLGDLSSGNHDIGIQLPVISPDGASVQFSYQIVNSGFDRSTENSVKNVMNKLSDAAAKLLTGLFGYKEVWDKLNQGTHWLNDMQFIDCDGVVAADSIEAPASTLQSWTAQGPHRETRRYPGSPSPALCGDASLYFVDWSLRPLTALEIADLVDHVVSQDNWRWCNKCQGLAWAGGPRLGACPAGGEHDHRDSGNYRLTSLIPGQDNWRWCNKCQGLAYAGTPTMGACPAGGQHDHTDSGNYVLQSAGVLPGQDNWRWCNKCQGLAYAGTPTMGACPAGGQHDHTDSGNYVLTN